MKQVQTINTNSQTVESNGVFNVGAIDRRVGNCAFNVNSTSIVLKESGWYDVNVSLNGTSLVGNAQIQLYQNNVPSSGAISTIVVAAVDDPISLTINKTFKVYGGCCPLSGPITLTLVNTGDIAITSTSLIINIVKTN